MSRVTSSSVRSSLNAGDGERRGEEVVDAASLAEELGHHATPKSSLVLDGPTPARGSDAAGRPRFLGERCCGRRPPEIDARSAMTPPISSVTRSTKPRSTVPSLPRGRADGHENDIRILRGLLEIGRHTEQARLAPDSDELVEPGSTIGLRPSRDRFELVRIDVDADDRVPQLRQGTQP